MTDEPSMRKAFEAELNRMLFSQLGSSCLVSNRLRATVLSLSAGLFLAALSVAMSGCSGSGPAPTYRVTGTVKLPDGTPLTGGQILFRPSGEDSYPAKGIIGADGSFQLGTFEIDDGAIAGKHQVMITPEVSDDMMEDASLRKSYRPMVHASYQSLRTTPLEFTVDSNAKNHFDIELEKLR